MPTCGISRELQSFSLYVCLMLISFPLYVFLPPCHPLIIYSPSFLLTPLCLPLFPHSCPPPSSSSSCGSVGRMAWPCVPSSTDTDPTSLTTPNWERWPVLPYFPLYFQPLYWTMINAGFLCLFTFIIEALLEIFFPVNWFQLIKKNPKRQPITILHL